MELNELDTFHGTTTRSLDSKSQADEWVDAEPVEPEEQAIIDIQEAIRLFATVKTMLDYISDPDLCRSVSRREREVMIKLSEKVRSFLATVEPTYIEDDCEDE